MGHDRWRRMSKIVDIDLDEASQTLKAFESELENAELQLKTLTEFRQQSEDQFSQPCSYNSVQDMQRQLTFIESLKFAMDQQQSLVHSQYQHLEALRLQVLELYQKKESYLLLAEKAQDEEQKGRSRQEDDFLDDISQQNSASQRDF